MVQCHATLASTLPSPQPSSTFQPAPKSELYGSTSSEVLKVPTTPTTQSPNPITYALRHLFCYQLTSGQGPIQVYLAKVSNAASSGTSGLSWFKIASDGLSGGKWGVDNMVSNNGWAYFTLPSCIAPGNYLMRVELIALHSAGTSGQAQFYVRVIDIPVVFSPLLLTVP